jgi:hypothetical protein
VTENDARGEGGRRARSALEADIRAGRFVLTTSLGTLKGIDGPLLRQRLRDLRSRFRFVKFGDNPRARARPSPWAAAAVAIDEGLEPVVHQVARPFRLSSPLAFGLAVIGRQPVRHEPAVSREAQRPSAWGAQTRS